jgi:hypothetical protein
MIYVFKHDLNPYILRFRQREKTMDQNRASTRTGSRCAYGSSQTNAKLDIRRCRPYLRDESSGAPHADLNVQRVAYGVRSHGSGCVHGAPRILLSETGW